VSKPPYDDDVRGQSDGKFKDARLKRIQRRRL